MEVAFVELDKAAVLVGNVLIAPPGPGKLNHRLQYFAAAICAAQERPAQRRGALCEPGRARMGEGRIVADHVMVDTGLGRELQDLAALQDARCRPPGCGAEAGRVAAAKDFGRGAFQKHGVEAEPGLSPAQWDAAFVIRPSEELEAGVDLGDAAFAQGVESGQRESDELVAPSSA